MSDIGIKLSANRMNWQRNVINIEFNFMANLILTKYNMNEIVIFFELNRIVVS